MKPELRELLAQLETKKTEIRSLTDNGEVDKAHSMLEEVRSIEKQIELQETLQPKKKEVIKPMENRETNVFETLEYRTAFIKVLAGKQLTNEERSLFGTVDGMGQGTYVVPTTIASTIYTYLQENSPIRQLANVITTGSNMVIAMQDERATASWTLEGGDLHQSQVSLKKIEFFAHKLSTVVKITNELIADALVDVENYVAQEIADAILHEESKAFVDGDGVNKPTGLLNGIEITQTHAELSYNALVDVLTGVSFAYRSGGAFLISDDMFAEMLKMKDEVGRPLLVHDATANVPYSIFGKHVFVDSYLPQGHVIFGNFGRGYQIIDRQNIAIRTLTELFAMNDVTGIMATKRTDAKGLDKKALVKATFGQASAVKVRKK